MAAEKTDATFALKLDDKVSEVSTKVADSLEGLREAVRRDQSEIGKLRKAMNGLKGNSDEVVAAKQRLKSQIDALNGRVTSHRLEMIKAGTSYEELAARSKTLKKTLEAQNKELDGAKTKAFGAAVSAAGGPVASLRDKVRTLADAAGGPGARGFGIMTLAVAGTVAAIAAVVAAIAGGVVAFSRWALSAANAERSMSLVREAATGSAADAKALGSHVDDLADKLATSRGALNDMGASLAGGKLKGQGQTLVDTFHAVAQAAAAMGDQAGAKIREIAERSARSKRMFVNPFELQGTGLKIDDIAKELSDGTAKGIAKARQALVEGRVALSAGAEAMRKAVEKRFGEINLRKLGDLTVLGDKLREKLSRLASGINLEPLSRAASKLLAIFDESSVTGDTLKRVVTALGNNVVSILEQGIPKVKTFVQEMVIGGLKIYILYLKVRNALRDAFADDGVIGKLGLTKGAIEGLKTAFMTAAVAVGVLVGALAAVVAFNVALVAGVGFVVKKIGELGEAIGKWFVGTNFSDLGKSIIEGIVHGISSGIESVKEAVSNVAGAAKNAFKSVLEINSPSKVFKEFGGGIPEGVAGGVEKNKKLATDAVEVMADEAAAVGADRGSRAVVAAAGRRGGGGEGGDGGDAGAMLAGSPGGRGGLVVHATFVFQGSGGGAKEQVEAQKESLLEQITKLFEDAATASGLAGAT